MKKLLVSSIAASLFAVSATSVQAATVAQTFDVSVTLSAVCRVVGAPIANPVLNFGTYTAFGAATTPAPTAAFSIECTRGMAAPSFSFDTVATNPTYGVLAGLNYDVTASSVVFSAGTAASAAALGYGTPAVHTITLTGNMAGGQAGDCAGASEAVCAATPKTATRTLTITY